MINQIKHIKHNLKFNWVLKSLIKRKKHVLKILKLKSLAFLLKSLIIVLNFFIKMNFVKRFLLKKFLVLFLFLESLKVYFY